MSHPAAIMAAMKRCSACKQEKPSEEFNKNASQADGLHNECRECKRERDRLRYGGNSESIRARRRAYYYENRVAAIAYSVSWAKANRERYVEYHRKWRSKNPERRRAAVAKWDRANLDKRAESSRRRKAIKLQVSVAEFSEQELRQRLSMFSGCWLCGGEADSVDHVKPLAKGGLHTLSNLRPACGVCNSRKGDRWPFPIRQAA